VTVNDAASLDLTDGMTLEAWVRPSSNGITAWRTVVLKEQSGQLIYALYSNTDTNRPSGHVYVGGDRDVRGTSQVAANTWTHLATTYDGSRLRLYVNGTLVNTRAQTGKILTSGGVLRIGGNSVWPEFFRGRIDEVRIYNRALTAAEIQSDMNAPVSGP
jgi:hypothetical protein